MKTIIFLSFVILSTLSIFIFGHPMEYVSNRRKIFTSDEDNVHGVYDEKNLSPPPPYEGTPKGF